MGLEVVNEAYVVDTHALFWYLTKPDQLSENALTVFVAALAGQTQLVLSAIVLLELHALIRKAKAPIDFRVELKRFQSAGYYRIEPITVADLLLLDDLHAITDIHDRAIVATAVRLGAPMLTRDLAIQSSAIVPCVW